MKAIFFYVKITRNLLLFPLLYLKHKAYPTFGEHFAAGDRLPGEADFVVALGCSLRADGTAASPTRAIAEKAAEVFASGRAAAMLLSGGNPVNGVTEGEAMGKVVAALGLNGPGVRVDDLPRGRYVGTLDQVRSIENVLKQGGAKDVILVVQPQQMARALWLFRRLVPDIHFYPVNPADAYDGLSTQARMRRRWRFRLWNMIAWSGLWLNPELRKTEG